MHGNRRIAGFDVGTSSLKVTLVDYDTGVITDNLKYEYNEYTEISQGVIPAKVYENTIVKALTEIYQSIELVSMGISTQMYSICEFKDKEWIVYQWNSLWQRNEAIEAELKEPLNISGCQVDTIFPAYKLKTLGTEKAKSYVPYGLKEHLIMFLTGKLATDFVTASASGLMDIKTLEWNTAFVQKLGVDVNLLPKLMNHFDQIGKIDAELFPNIYPQTIIVPGMGDGPSASFACKGISNLCGNLGTSMAVRAFVTEPDLNEEHGLWNFAVGKNRYITGGISSNACSVLNWSESIGIKNDDIKLIESEVMFFPWIHGERMPYWSSDLRGAFVGLKVSDNMSSMAGAVLKAVGFTFARMVQTMTKYVEKDKPLVIAGGGTNIKLLLSVIAGCLDMRIALLNNTEYLCSIGSAMSAAEMLRIEVEVDLKIDKTIEPTYKYKNEYKEWLIKANKLSDMYHN